LTKGNPNWKNVEKEHPVPRIESIHQVGLIEIAFSSEIQLVPNMTLITNGTIQIKHEDVPVLNVTIEPGEDSDPSKLNFTWRAVS